MIKQTHHPKDGTKLLFPFFIEIASKHLFCLPLLLLYQLSGKKSFYLSRFLLLTAPCQGPIISFSNSLAKLLANRRSWGRVFRSSRPSCLVYKKEVMSMSVPSWSSPNLRQPLRAQVLCLIMLPLFFPLFSIILT